jgi:hypothetical protein
MELQPPARPLFSLDSIINNNSMHRAYGEFQVIGIKQIEKTGGV